MRFRLWFASLTLALLAQTTSPGDTSGQARFDHAGQVGAGLAAAGGVSRLVPSNGLPQLAQQLFLLAELEHDLYEMQVALGFEYAMYRDTVSAGSGLVVPEAAFFVGRHLMEQGNEVPARSALQRAETSVRDQQIRGLARTWLQSMDEDARSWPAAYERWTRGLPAEITECPPGDSTECSLLKALLQNDLPAISRHRDAVAADTTPEYSHSAEDGSVAVHIGLYDPLGMRLAAAADFALASHLFELADETESLQAYALLRAGRASEAETLVSGLPASSGGLTSIVRAELHFGAGRTREAQRAWAEAAATLPELALDSQSRVDPEGARSAAEAYVARHREGDFRGLGGRGQVEHARLLRALLRLGLAAEAVQVSDATYFRSWQSDFNRVMPSVLALRSHSLFLSAGDRSKEARGFAWSLRRLLPAARPIAVMMQELTAPSQARGDAIIPGGPIDLAQGGER